MAFSEVERKRYEKIVEAYVERTRSPPHIRKDLDIAFRIYDQSIELFEVRQDWQNPEQTIEHPIIKATYMRRSGLWKVYWQRADMKWHRYEPEPEAETIEKVLDIVERDEYSCFYG